MRILIQIILYWCISILFCFNIKANNQIDYASRSALDSSVYNVRNNISVEDNKQEKFEAKLDTASINKEISKQLDLNAQNIKEKKWAPNSKHALLWALIPSAGQIYNRKYWKLPIVWGSFTACIYAFRFNQKKIYRIS